MTCRRMSAPAFAAVSLVLALAVPTDAQQSTGTITGRATDADGGALPGVSVSIASPQMIGGARSAVTDDQGVYRFTLLAAGTYTVSFTLAGFKTLNIEGVTINAGMTMTINGKLDLATLEETVTVTSQSSTIDLESARLQVNWERTRAATTTTRTA